VAGPARQHRHHLALAIFFAVMDRLSGFASEDIANEPAER
jgi:hypothetical protein